MWNIVFDPKKNNLTWDEFIKHDFFSVNINIFVWTNAVQKYGKKPNTDETISIMLLLFILGHFNIIRGFTSQHFP